MPAWLAAPLQGVAAAADPRAAPRGRWALIGRRCSGFAGTPRCAGAGARLAAGLSRERPHRARGAASRHLPRRDLARGQSASPRASRHRGREERRRADRRGEWPGPGRPTRASSRFSWIRRRALPPHSSSRKCAPCSTSFRTSWSRSTRCSPSVSARRCPGRWRPSSSACPVRTSMWTTRSRAASPRCCGSGRKAARCT